MPILISRIIVKMEKPTIKFQVIDTSIDPVSFAIAELPAGCHPARTPAKKGRTAKPITFGADQFGNTTKMVAATAQSAPTIRAKLNGCLTSTPIPKRSQSNPEITKPEIKVVWKVATPSTDAEAPSEKTTIAPQIPAIQFHQGKSWARIFLGIDANWALVEWRARIMTAITTKPEPNEITAAAFPSPFNVLPNCPLTADCSGESIPARIVASTSKGITTPFFILLFAESIFEPSFDLNLSYWITN